MASLPLIHVLAIATCVGALVDPLTPFLLRDSERHVQWNLMKRNFGTRWEGQTRWLKPARSGALESSAPPLSSVYQLEFPASTPGHGTWRGWNVIQAGDTREVALSEETVIDRTAGSTTFQFAGAGGRCSLATDGPGWGCEVNFFHGTRRSGLCVFYDTATGELSGVMTMAFRSAPISHDGNETFVDTPEFTVTGPVDPIAGDVSAPPPVLRAASCSRVLSLARPYYEISELSSPLADVDWSDTRGDSVLVEGFVDGLWLRAPRVLARDSTISLGCDFSAIGGPFRAITMLYEDADFTGVTCREYV